MSETMEYKCPNCGGVLNFDSKSQKMKCPYCDTEFDMETVKAYDKELNEKKEDSFDWKAYDKDSGNGDWEEEEKKNIVSYICKSCGGEILADKTTSAINCPYCGNPVVINDQFAGTYRPDFVIPFKLDKKEAKQALQNFLKNKKLLPSEFKNKNHIDSISGVYVPFWLYDCDTDAHIRYKATKTTAWSDSKYDYVRTDHYMVTRAGDVGFERVPVDGSKKMDDTYMEAIEPFTYKDLCDFQTGYLAGYLAEKYDVDVEEAKPRANERIKNSTLDAFGKTVMGYNSCIPEQVNINFEQGEVHYALLPVWMLNTKYKDKMYMFAMNGQTGKFVGELPTDMGKFWGYFFKVFFPVFLICFLITMFI